MLFLGIPQTYPYRACFRDVESRFPRILEVPAGPTLFEMGILDATPKESLNVGPNTSLLLYSSKSLLKSLETLRGASGTTALLFANWHMIISTGKDEGARLCSPAFRGSYPLYTFCRDSAACETPIGPGVTWQDYSIQPEKEQGYRSTLYLMLS